MKKRDKNSLQVILAPLLLLEQEFVHWVMHEVYCKFIETDICFAVIVADLIFLLVV